MNGSIAVGGREYSLRYTVNALCLLEDKAGGSLETLLQKGLCGLRGLLWCGLLWENRDITLEAAGDLIQSYLQAGGSLNEISSQVSLALENAGFFQRAGAESGPKAPQA